MSARAFPVLCPYCGDEDLRPHEVVDEDGRVDSPHGTWECRACLRAFRLTMLGQLPRPASVGRPEPSAPSAPSAPSGARS